MDTPIPSNPIVVLRLVEYVPENGSVFIGPHLMSKIEIDELSDRLIKDVESFRRLAKDELELAASRPPK